MVQSLEQDQKFKKVLPAELVSDAQRRAVEFLATQAARGGTVSCRSYHQAELLVTQLQSMGYGVTRDGLSISVYKQRPGDQLPHKVL
jgi:hypothetical protein